MKNTVEDHLTKSRILDVASADIHTMNHVRDHLIKAPLGWTVTTFADPAERFAPCFDYPRFPL